MAWSICMADDLPHLHALHWQPKMLKKIAPSIFIVWALCSEAHAASSIGPSLEDYHWQETIPGSSLSPTETGLRYALNIQWTEDGNHGLLFGFHGRFYAGRVHYDTFTQQTNMPVSTTTQYSGAAHEGQLAYRTDAGNYRLDYVGRVGVDSWQRREVAPLDWTEFLSLVSVA